MNIIISFLVITVGISLSCLIGYLLIYGWFSLVIKMDEWR